MMRLIFISGIVCGLGVSSLLAEPRIVCDQPTFDFGSRDASEVVTHTFELKNTGNSDLVISAVRPACGCTTAQLVKSVIQPGETSKLGAQLSLAGRGGEIQKTILIESNDPANPALELLMKGKVVTEFQVSPSILTLRQSAAGQPGVGAIHISSNGKPFKITKVESSLPEVQVRVDPMPDGLSYQISAALETIPATELAHFLLSIQTDNPLKQSLDIQSNIILQKKIILAPESIRICEKDSETKKYVLLKSADEDPLEIKEILTPDPAVKVDYSKSSSFIRLAIRGITFQSELNGKKITIIFNNDTTLEIPIYLSY
jgi:hypothetical protein